jgi:hypothetical protein
MAESIEKTIEKYKAIEEGTYKWPKPSRKDPEEISLFGGLCGIELSIPEFFICKGLSLRKTYAHVMSPYILAFKPPAKKGQPHPAPWKAANGGLGFDVYCEISLDKGCRPTGFDRVNTIWWVLALLRLKTGIPLQLPIISDTAFSSISQSKNEPNLWPIEISVPNYNLSSYKPIAREELEWLKNSFISGAKLMDTSSFNRAVQTFDSVIWAHSLGSALIMIWASLETLFQPGRQKISKGLSACIATYLHPPGSARDRAFQKIAELYGARGSAAHNSETPEREQLAESIEIARECLLRAISHQQLPNSTALIQAWKEKMPYATR